MGSAARVRALRRAGETSTTAAARLLRSRPHETWPYRLWRFRSNGYSSHGIRIHRTPNLSLIRPLRVQPELCILNHLGGTRQAGAGGSYLGWAQAEQDDPTQRVIRHNWLGNRRDE